MSKQPLDTTTGQVVITTFHSIAIASTVFRLVHRVRIRRFSWDDSSAALALVFESIYMTAGWARTRVAKNITSTQDVRYQLKVLMWILTSLFTILIWTCRISLTLSIARVLPFGRLRTFTLLFSVLCFLQGAILIIVKSVSCTIDYARLPPIQCTWFAGRIIGVGQVVMDILSTAILVILPIYILWDWKSRSERARQERRLVMLLFMASLLTLVACLVHAIYNIEPDSFKQAYSAQLEVAVSLLVCNLLVVVTSIYQIIRRWKDPESREDGGLDTSEPVTDFSSDPQSQSLRKDTTTFPIETGFSATEMYSLGSDVDSSALERHKVDVDNPSTTGREVSM